MLHIIRSQSQSLFLFWFPQYRALFNEVSLKAQVMLEIVQTAFKECVLEGNGDLRRFSAKAQTYFFHSVIFQITRYQEFIDIREYAALAVLDELAELHNKINQ
jgi:hypothetical protein